MKKSLFLGAMALGAVACTPEIEQEAPNTNVGLAEFDPTGSPAVVPSPNDLAIRGGVVNAPINPAASLAEQEFTRDYLNTLNGFPTSAIASTKVQDLDPRTVNERTVVFIDLYAGTPLAKKPVTPTIAYNETTDLINLIPPVDANTGLPAWPKGGRYAVALIGGENGLKTNGGNPVIGSATWAFASSVKPLVTCEDLTAPDCAPATEIIPSKETDPAKRLAAQTASALQLEQLRRGYAPLIEGLVAKGFKREDVVLLWTFSVLNQPEATINLAANARLPIIIPFPNDLLRVPATSTAPAHLNFPVPAEAGLQQQLFTGLNTLDGFSTTGPTVSENGDAHGVLDGTQFRTAADGAAPRVDASSLAAGVKFFKLSNLDKGTAPDVTPCLVEKTGDCGTSVGTAGVVPVPQQLQVRPNAPLDGATQYGAVLTTELKDTQGRKVAPATAFALMRLANPVAVGGKSQISSVPDSLAAALEPVRAAHKPYFDALEKAGLKRSQIALGWAFTTQSTTSVLQGLYTLPTALGAATAPNYVVPTTAQVKAVMTASGLPSDGIGGTFEVQANSPFLLTGPSDTLNPAEPRPSRYPFMLFLPATAAPATGYPVLVFGHGLTSNRTSVLGVANKLTAAGYAVVAMDAVYHGERTSCVGSAAVLGTTGTVGDDGACADPATQRCETNRASVSYGRCVARLDANRAACGDAERGPVPADLFCSNNTSPSQGRCAADNKCEGGDFKRNASGIPVISGWNFLNLGNLFTTRDNFRHHVLDFSQFLRVLGSPELSTALTAQGGGKLDASQVDYVGQSLGGILGTLSSGVSSRVHRSVLNVAGGNLTSVLLTSPAFQAQRDAFLGQLATAGITPGIPAFDTFIGLANTILDPADPRNYAYLLDNNAAAGTDANVHRAFIQYIEGDQVIPNANTDALIAAANRAKAPRTVATYMFKIDTLPAAARHAFLNNPAIPETVRNAAQDQLIGFLKTGTVAQ
ncbi:hypothetical protein [Corallococcus llansteffanensis]|uniref:Lipase n=1 Tax=Corallococcus llansteffanensis TaxID=2316731 RepID=A0A3A8NXX1_9BACT|nr:hypothetical protein [Corallococcus llansteffanensis]RKH48359.1 hypothetical protein D7V93_33340 [Corallococcus llansteffanensis]